ncbi:MAG TPA: phenylalanine 4-monooxygenase [Stellaceae bacterium]|jgi:phenylalanine-4-hydroxylase|nr:phenylalanine 4-monooxygenase [Stellaceae bacterium]
MKDLEQFDIEQEWASYTPEQHSIWRKLFHRQEAILARRACQPFLDGLKALGVEAEGIPDFRRLNEALERATRWRIVAVPGLVPDDVFFEHLANRRFPSTCFIRRADQLDYLQEPDIFHDIFGHVPMLVNPIFADYMEAYGKGGLKALRLHNLEHLARLYWYTVEFGLIATPEGIRIYGSGIVSSKGESIYCLEDPKPNRIAFDLLRVMRTRYRIDDYQESYFVIDSFEQLFEATQPDFTPYYAELARLSDLDPGAVLTSDRFLEGNPA